MRSRHSKLPALLLLIVIAFTPLFAHGQTRVISNVSTNEGAAGLEIRISFNYRLQYVSHSSASDGSVLHIELRPVATAGDAAASLAVRERLDRKATPKVPLSQVVYDGRTAARPGLTLKFTRGTRYQVRGTGDLRSLLVVIPAGRPAESAQTAATPPLPAPAAVSSAPYAVNLASQLTPHDPAAIPSLEIFERYRLYTMIFEKDGRIWHRLRLGFFPTRRAAERAAESLSKTYPQAWVTRVPEKERQQSSANAIGGPASPLETGDTAPAPESGAGIAVSPGRLVKVMEQAKDAMTAGDYNRAVALFTAILDLPDSEFHPEAQELLGLARERKGQLAQAQAAYDEYLRRYPDNEGADRVRQRLAGLITARAEPPKPLREATDAEEPSGWEFDSFGSIFQFYTRAETLSDLEDGDEPVQQSELTSDLDFSAEARNQNAELGFDFVGGHVADFRNDSNDNEIDGSSDEFELNTLFVDALHFDSGLSGRAGRQTLSTSGVLGRFDGGIVSYQALSQARINGFSGFVVDTTSLDTFETDRYFYGLSLDLGTFADYWDFNVFGINQTVDGITDRRAAGGEVRYFHPERSFFTLFDYDILYNEPNIALFSGTWLFPDHTSLNVGADYRKSPFLTTTNALQGQNADTIDELREQFSDNEIRDLADDRTANSHSFSVGLSRPFFERYQFSGDVTASKLSSTDASGGAAATDGTGYEFFYSGQAIGSSLFKERDLTIIGLRFNDADTTNTLTGILNTRYPITPEWFLNPEFTASHRWNEDDDGTRLTLRPSLRTEYYWHSKGLRFEIEAGLEWENNKQNGVSDSMTDFFMLTGYRFDF